MIELRDRSQMMIVRMWLIAVCVKNGRKVTAALNSVPVSCVGLEALALGVVPKLEGVV